MRARRDVHDYVDVVALLVEHVSAFIVDQRVDRLSVGREHRVAVAINSVLAQRNALRERLAVGGAEDAGAPRPSLARIVAERRRR